MMAINAAARAAAVTCVVMVAPVAPALAQDVCAATTSPQADPGVTLVCQALAAVNAFNPTALGHLMADDFSLTGVSGQHFGASKADMVRRWTTADPGVTSRTQLTHVFRTHASGTVRFVSGEMVDITRTVATTTCEGHAFTDVWEQRSGRWLWVHSHESGHRVVTCP